MAPPIRFNTHLDRPAASDAEQEPGVRSQFRASELLAAALSQPGTDGLMELVAYARPRLACRDCGRVYEAQVMLGTRCRECADGGQE